jgi:O-antigen/teichoic acid export membrane protein
MQVNISNKDVIWSYAGTVTSLASNVIMLPFIIYFLSSDMLGLWYVFSSIGVIATLFDFGFGVTFARNITYCWSGAETLKKENVAFVQNKEPDYRLMKNVLLTCRRIYLGISSLVLVLMLTGGTGYILYVSRNVGNRRYLIAWAIYSAAVFLNLYYGYFSSFLRGVGAIKAVNQNTVIARGIQIVVTIGLLVSGMGLIGVCTAYLLYGTTFRALGKYKFMRYQGIGENLKKVHSPVCKKEEWALFRIVWHNAWKDGVVAISNYLSNEMSTLVCSMYLSLSATGVYSLGGQISMAIATVSSTLYMAYQPALQAAYINRDKKKMQSLMSVIVTVYICTFAIGLAGTLAVVLPVLRWFKPSSAVPFSVFLGLSLYQFMLKFRNCYTSYFSCTNRLPYVKSFIISAVLCVLLSFLFMGPLKLGLFGLITAQIVSQAVYNIWYWPYRAHRELELSFPEMFRIGIEKIKSRIPRFTNR